MVKDKKNSRALIYKLFEYYHITTKELAIMVDISPRTIEGWLQGRPVNKRSMRKLLKLKKMAEAEDV